MHIALEYQQRNIIGTYMSSCSAFSCRTKVSAVVLSAPACKMKQGEQLHFNLKSAQHFQKGNRSQEWTRRFSRTQSVKTVWPTLLIPTPFTLLTELNKSFTFAIKNYTSYHDSIATSPATLLSPSMTRCTRSTCHHMSHLN